MKTSLKTTAAAALSLIASQALAFETEIERVGMLYLNIPLNTQSVPKIDKSVMGLRFGQTRISTDSAGSLFTYFRSRPALFDVQFGMVGKLNSPDDLHFGLLDLKLTGISSVEKTYINGQAVVGSIVATKILAGAAAVGGIAVAAAASGSGNDSEEDSSTESSSSKNDDKDDDVAEHGNEHEEDHENEHENEAENEHENEHENEAENEHENEHEEEHENEHENEAENEHEDDHEDDHENEVEGPEGIS